MTDFGAKTAEASPFSFGGARSIPLLLMTPRESVRSSCGDKQKLSASAVLVCLRLPKMVAETAWIHGLEAIKLKERVPRAEEWVEQGIPDCLWCVRGSRYGARALDPLWRV